MPSTDPFPPTEPTPPTEPMPPSDAAELPPPDEQPPSWPERRPAGAVWRGAAVVVVAVIGTVLSAWLAAKLIRYDSRLVTGPTAPAALIVGALVGAWLRARNAFVLTSVLATLVAAQATAYLLHDGLIDALRRNLVPSGFAVFEEWLAGGSTAVALVCIVWATVSGYRNPRDPRPADQPSTSGQPGIRQR